MQGRTARETFSRSRLGTFDVGVISRDKHHVTGLLEVDVTAGRERLRRLRRDGTAVPLPVLLHRSETYTVREIEAQITDATTQKVAGAEDFQLGRRRSKLVMAIYYRLPQPIRIWIMKRILRNPSRHKATMGTVVVSSLTAGMRFPGWILPTSIHNLAFGVGSVVRKPRVVDEQVLPRDVLHLTVMFDHNVVDGAPAARFMSRLVRILETASVLEIPSSTETVSPSE